MKLNNKNVGAGIGLLLLSQYAAAASTNLGSYGQTRLQQDTGDAVQTTCGGFVASQADPTIPLFATCRAMVHTANDLTGTGVSRDSLGLNADQLAVSLQQIATEEFAATESMATEISSNRTDPVLNRLSALRAGASGFSVSGFTPQASADILADAGWLDGVEGVRGGSAGDDDFGSRLSGFASINYGTGSRDGSDRTDEFDYDSYNITLGADYRLGNNVVVGAAINYYDIDTEFATSPTVSGGSVENDGYGLAVYASWYGESFYLDGLAGYGVSNYELERTIFIPSTTAVAPIINTAEASPDSTDSTLSFGAGYTFNPGALSWGPYFRLAWINVDIDDYQEKGAEASGLNLDVDSQDWTSLTTSLGAQFSYAISSGAAVIVPQARVGWIHQYENDATVMTAVYVEDPRNNVLSATTDEPDRDYAELGIAVSAVFQGGSQAFFSYDTLLGFENLSTHLFTLGGRWEF
jgi:outer membrane autotransporter protein